MTWDDSAARKRRLREKRRAAGWLEYLVWLYPDGHAALEALRRPGETIDAVVNRALVTLQQLLASGTSPTRTPALHGTSPVPSPAHRPVQTGTSPVPSPTASRPDTAPRPAPPEPDPAQARFIALWEQGREVKAIAAELGITWTAAQSRAHRLQQQGLIQPRPRGGDYPSRRAQARQRPETP